ncbi:hypothetical protein ANN_21093 [Periplaneta americana]|uniref:Uncharacterized protein n=1 Tax=Periplaneta americana TaxID=6978 RepID=A0ABQ8SEE6_PERAM|nr:hypothetical protein ANN_21093 [Periplaneta americana]
MASLCEGGNEPPGSLKAKHQIVEAHHMATRDSNEVKKPHDNERGSINMMTRHGEGSNVELQSKKNESLLRKHKDEWHKEHGKRKEDE